MAKLLTKIRYFLWGKQIQANMERAEESGRTSAMFHWEQRFNRLKLEHKMELDALSPAKDYVVDHRDVITARALPDGSTSLIYLGTEQLNSQEIANLKAEVKFLRASKIWPIITATLKSQAQDVMFNRSQTFDDMIAGKMMLRNLDVQEKIMSSIEKFADKKP